MPRIPYDPLYISFVTSVTYKRRKIFDDPRMAERLGMMMHMACRGKGFIPLAYAILPDHFHLLVCSVDFFDQRFYPTWRSGGLESPPQSAQRTTMISSENKNDNSAHRDSGGLSRPPNRILSYPVANLIQSIKGTFSSILPHGQIWQRRYHLRYHTDPRDIHRTIEYIQYNFQKSNVSERFGTEPYVWINEEKVSLL